MRDYTEFDVTIRTCFQMRLLLINTYNKDMIADIKNTFL